MSNKTIYNALVAAGLTQEGACGLMGNMMAESTMKSNIAQRGMTSMTDEQYTAAADNGMIDFASDSVGYGLCQWTSSDRKAKLLAFAKNRGVSVGDEAMQIQFCLLEMMQSPYQSVAMTLRSSHDIDECADRVCDKYERPANNNYQARRQYARQFFNEFAGSGALSQEHVELIGTGDNACFNDGGANVGISALVIILQMFMRDAGYWNNVTGDRSPEFFAALRIFIDDLEKLGG